MTQVNTLLETADLKSLMISSHQPTAYNSWFCDLVYEFKNGKPIFIGETSIDFAEFMSRILEPIMNQEKYEELEKQNAIGEWIKVFTMDGEEKLIYGWIGHVGPEIDLSVLEKFKHRKSDQEPHYP